MNKKEEVEKTRKRWGRTSNAGVHQMRPFCRHSFIMNIIIVVVGHLKSFQPQKQRFSSFENKTGQTDQRTDRRTRRLIQGVPRQLQHNKTTYFLIRKCNFKSKNCSGKLIKCRFLLIKCKYCKFLAPLFMQLRLNIVKTLIL